MCGNATLEYIYAKILQITGQVLISCFCSPEPAGPVKKGTLNSGMQGYKYSASQHLQLSS